MSAGAGGGQYDYVLSIGFSPQDLRRVEQTLGQIARRVQQTTAGLAGRIAAQAATAARQAPLQVQDIEKAYQRAAVQGERAAERQRRAAERGQRAADKHRKSVDDTATAYQRLRKDIDHAIGKIATWAIATGAVYGALNGLRQSVTTITEVDFALTGLRKVYQGHVGDIQGMADAAVNMAERYGSSISAVIDGMRDWARQGYRAKEVVELTTVSLLAQNIAEMSAVDATRYLTAALNQFDLQASTAMATLDAWNELSNRYAATTRDIAEGVARLGRTAADAGLSIQEASAMVTVLIERTKRSGAQIGTALRTLFTYTFREKNIRELEKVGIFIRRQHGEMLDLMTVLTQLSAKWVTLTDVQKQAIAEAFGVRRVTEFRTLLDSLPAIIEATTIAYESQGSALKENIIFLDSIQVRYGRLKAALQGLAVSSETQSTLKGLLEILRKLVQVIDVVGVKATALAVPLGIMLFRTRALTVAVRAAMLAIGGAQVVATRLNVSLAGTTVAITGVRAALHSLYLSLGPVGVALAAAAIALAVWKTADRWFNRAAYEAERLAKAVQEIEATTIAAKDREAQAYATQIEGLRRRANLLYELRDQYKEVSEGADKTGKKQEELRQILILLQKATKDSALAFTDSFVPGVEAVERVVARAVLRIGEMTDKMREAQIQALKGKEQELRGVLQKQERAVEAQEKAVIKRIEDVKRAFTPKSEWSIRQSPLPDTIEKTVRGARDLLDTLEKVGAESYGATQDLAKALGKLDEYAGKTKQVQAEIEMTRLLILELEHEQAGIPEPTEPEPDPLGNLGKRVQTYDRLVRRALNLTRELRQAMEQVDASVLGRWFTRIQQFSQRWEDMADRSREAVEEIDRAMATKGISAATKAALADARARLEQMRTLFKETYPLAYRRQWFYAMQQARGGIAAIEAERTQRLDALRMQMERLRKETADAQTVEYMARVQILETLRIELDYVKKLHDYRQEEMRLEQQIAQAQAGAGWKYAMDQYRFLQQALESAQARLRAEMDIARSIPGVGGQTVWELVQSLRGSSDDWRDIAMRVLDAQKNVVQATQAIKQFRDTVRDLVLDYREFHALQVDDYQTMLKIADEQFREAQRVGDLRAMLTVLREQVSLREQLLRLQHDYNMAMIDFAGNDIIAQAAELRRRYEETGNLAEQLQIWQSLARIRQDYEQWQLKVAGEMRRANLPTEFDRIIDRVQELQRLLQEWPVTTERGRQYFDELRGYAERFLQEWYAGIERMSDAFADAITQAFRGEGDIWQAVHQMFADITKEWVQRIVRENMGTFFEELMAARERAAGRESGKALAAQIGIGQYALPQLEKLPNIAAGFERVQAALADLGPRIAMMDTQIRRELSSRERELVMREKLITALGALTQAFQSAATTFSGGGIVPGVGGAVMVTPPATAGGQITSLPTVVGPLAGLAVQSISRLGRAVAENTIATVQNTAETRKATTAATAEGAPAVGAPATSKRGFFQTKAGKAVISGLGVYSAYQAGDPLTGALAGYSLGTLAGASLGPVGAAVGFFAGLAGKKKQKKDTQQLPPKQYERIWTPPDVMWPVSPLYGALGYAGFARGPYGPAWGAGAEITPYEYTPTTTTWQPMSRWHRFSGEGRTAPVIGSLNIVVQGTGYTHTDARRLSNLVHWELTRRLEVETASGRKIGNVG